MWKLVIFKTEKDNVSKRQQAVKRARNDSVFPNLSIIDSSLLELEYLSGFTNHR